MTNSAPAETGRPGVFVDLHSHTVHSHASDTTEAMYEAAKAKGLEIFGFSEHSPRPLGYTYPKDYQEKLVRGFPKYISEVQAVARRGEKDGIKILLGLEVDYIPAEEKYAAELAAAHPYDYCIGGLHFQGSWGFDHSEEDWRVLSELQRFAVYATYYRDLAALGRCGLFQTAAHPDLVKLFTVGTFRKWLNTDEADALITAALTALKESGTAMEVSSAGLRKPCKEIYPGPFIMQRAFDLGLNITFGSDAHCVNTPAFGFDELARYAYGFGFRKSLYFTGRKPVEREFCAPPVLS